MSAIESLAGSVQQLAAHSVRLEQTLREGIPTINQLSAQLSARSYGSAAGFELRQAAAALDAAARELSSAAEQSARTGTRATSYAASLAAGGGGGSVAGGVAAAVGAAAGHASDALKAAVITLAVAGNTAVGPVMEQANVDAGIRTPVSGLMDSTAQGAEAIATAFETREKMLGDQPPSDGESAEHRDPPKPRPSDMYRVPDDFGA